MHITEIFNYFLFVLDATVFPGEFETCEFCFASQA